MSDIRNLSGTSVDTGVSAPASEVLDAGEALEEDQLAFDDALAKDGELHESQSSETRKAIKRSLDRFQAPPETDGTSGSSESEPADASPGRSTRLTAGRAAGAVVSDGPARARETPMAANAGGEDSVTARGRSQRNDRFAPPVGAADAGGKDPASAQGRSQRNDRFAPPVGAADAGGKDPASAQGRSQRNDRFAPPVGAADAGGKDPASAQGRSQRNGPSSPPVSDGGNRGVPASSWPSTIQSPATADRKQAGPTAEGVPVPGHARAGSAVETTAARTTPTTGAQAVSMRVPGGHAASRTDDIASGPGADGAHEPDIAAIDMTGVAAPAGIAESGQTSVPEGVQAAVSHAAELAEQIADRILVSMPDSGAPGEVRISLKQSILDGSDVRIFHEEGELKVVFVAETESAQRFLASNREHLQQALGERLQDQRVRVEVELPNRGGASREDNRGRSRQQYVPQDDSSGTS